MVVVVVHIPIYVPYLYPPLGSNSHPFQQDTFEHPLPLGMRARALVERIGWWRCGGNVAAMTRDLV
jgi:hypothetical protein